MAEITADEGRTVGESGSFGRCFPLVPEPDNRNVTGLLDELLCDIYGKSDVKRKLSSATNGECSWQDSDNRHQRFWANLKQIEIKCWTKGKTRTDSKTLALSLKWLLKVLLGTKIPLHY